MSVPVTTKTDKVVLRQRVIRIKQTTSHDVEQHVSGMVGRTEWLGTGLKTIGGTDHSLQPGPSCIDVTVHRILGTVTVCNAIDQVRYGRRPLIDVSDNTPVALRTCF